MICQHRHGANTEGGQFSMLKNFNVEKMRVSKKLVSNVSIGPKVSISPKVVLKVGHLKSCRPSVGPCLCWHQK